MAIKSLCLKLLILVLTGIDNIAQNPFYEYFIQNSIFECLVNILYQTSGEMLYFSFFQDNALISVN